MSSLLTDLKAVRDVTSQEREEVAFTNAFNAQRPTLAGFSKCKDRAELEVVRDGFYLGLGSDLCPEEYEAVKRVIVEDMRVAAAAGTAGGFQATVESARGAEGWSALVAAVFAKARRVNSDLEGLWGTLERGRLEWLGALAAAHPIKSVLKTAIEQDAASTDGDASDAKMIWIYSLSLSIPQLKDAAAAWAKSCAMVDPNQPLRGYAAEQWDARKPEWRPLDIGAQEAADRGGASLEEAWRA